MKAIKKLNNNAVVCVDGKGRELIAIGKVLVLVRFLEKFLLITLKEHSMI